MAKAISLVQCVMKKQSGTSEYPARELYTSAWFQKASHYAARTSPEWYILSAKYHLVHPDDLIRPYDLTLKDMSVRERKEWSQQVFLSLKAKLDPGDSLVLLAGVAYRKYLLGLLSDSDLIISIPLKGLKNGQQLQWFNRSMGLDK